MATSLRGRLLRTLLLPVAALLALGAVAEYYVALRPASEAYDQALVDMGLALGERIRVDEGRAAFDLPRAAERVLRTDQFDTIYFGVRGPEGLLAGDAGLPPVPRASAPEDGVIAYDGAYGGRRVRVVAILVPCGAASCTVQVAETTVKRERFARNLALTGLAPLLVIASLTLAVVWFGVKRGLAPLETLSDEIRARAPGDLRPVDDRQAPLEARPLVGALNEVFGEVAAASQYQQRFLANAAHQLRTPLAGLQAHAELALAKAPPGAAQAELEQVRGATVRIARLASQLLALARVEPGGNRAAPPAPLDLRAVVEDAADEWVHRALDKDMDLGFELAEARVAGDALLLREALGNLLHNAIEYGAAGGRITVRTAVRNGSAILEVEDDGPGIPAAERGRVLERFYRVPGTPGTGSGLGLAIVAEIAAAHGAALAIGAGEGGRGCKVGVTFPHG